MVSNEKIKFEVLLGNLLRARFPLLYIESWEEERLLTTICAVACNNDLIRTPRKVFSWTITKGLFDLDSEEEGIRDPIEALEYIEKYNNPAVFIMYDFHFYFGRTGVAIRPDVIRKVRDMSSILKQSRVPKNIIFVSPTLILPIELQKDVTLIDYCLPCYDDIKVLLKEMIEANHHRNKININLSESDEEKIIKSALGLTLQEVENAFARALVECGCLDIRAVNIILDEKSQIIKKFGLLEYIKSQSAMEDVGGLDNFKKWLMKRDKSWSDSAQRYSLPSPKGVLVTGVPGCGKSLMAKAISSMWHLPLLRLDVGSIFSGIVGSSEENLRKAISVTQAIAPCILWIDEIEKGLNFSSYVGDGGTSNRIFGSLLTWLQEKTDSVFVIATANNVEHLPAELLRKGRFDEIFFVDLPTTNERKEIFRIHFRRRLINEEIVGDMLVHDQLLQNFAEMTEGFSGAEIEQLIISALFDAFAENRSITKVDIERSICNTIPMSVLQAEKIRAIREWANARAVAATPREDRLNYKEEHQGEKTDVRSTRGGRTVDF